MCGRFSLSTAEKQILLDRFNASEIDFELKPRYNIAPTQDVPVILNENPSLITESKWGLIPSWAKDEKIAYKTINARMETIEEKPAYRNSYKKHRCLIPADGFYEWDKKTKTPYRITLKDNSLFAFAGIYSEWNNIMTFSIVTTEPNSLMKKIHIRMPVILHREDEKKWLDEPDKALLKPFDGEMKVYEISKLVNSPKNDTKEILKEVKRTTLADF